MPENAFAEAFPSAYAAIAPLKLQDPSPTPFDKAFPSVGRPEWRDDRIPLHERLDNFVKVRAAAVKDSKSPEETGTIYAGARDDFRRIFPDVDPDEIHNHFALEARKVLAAKRTGEDPTEFAERRMVPYGSTVGSYKETAKYNAAVKAYEAKNPTADDLDTIALYENLQEIDKNRTGPESVWEGVALAPAFVGELMTGGRLVGMAVKGAAKFFPGLAARVGANAVVRSAYAPGLRGAAVRGAAKNVAATPLAPAGYLAQAQANAAQNGGSVADFKNLAPPLALSAIQNAVIGTMSGGLAAKVPTRLGRIAAGTAIGVTEANLADAATSGFDDAVKAATGETLGLNTRYGPVAAWVRGDDDAGKHLATQIVTFGVFAGLHSGRRQAADLRRSAVQAVDNLAKKGVPRPAALDAVAAVGERFDLALRDDPATAWDDFRQAYKDGKHADAVKPYAEALAKVGEEAAQPKQEKADAVEPQTGPEGPPALRGPVAPDLPAPRQGGGGADALPEAAPEPSGPAGRELAAGGRAGGEPAAGVGAVKPQAAELAKPLDGLGDDKVAEIAKAVGLSPAGLRKVQDEPWVAKVVAAATAPPQIAPGAPPRQAPPGPAVRPPKAPGSGIGLLARQRQAQAERGDVPAPKPVVVPPEARSVDELPRQEPPPPPEVPLNEAGRIAAARTAATPRDLTPDTTALWRAMEDKGHALSEPQRAIIERRLAGHTQPAIAADFGVTRQAVHSAEKAAVKKLGFDRTVAKTAFASAEADRVAKAVADGKAVSLTDLTVDPKEVSSRADKLTTDVIRENELSAHADAYLKDVESATKSGRTVESVAAEWAARIEAERRTAAAGKATPAQEASRQAGPPVPPAEVPRPPAAAPDVSAVKPHPSAEEVGAKLVADAIAANVGRIDFRGPGTAASSPFGPAGTPRPIAEIGIDTAKRLWGAVRNEFKKQAGEAAPATTALSRRSGEAVARASNAEVYGKYAAPQMIDAVMGPLTRPSDRRIVGGMITEMRLRHMRDFFSRKYREWSVRSAAFREQSKAAIGLAAKEKDPKAAAKLRAQGKRLQGKATKASKLVTGYVRLAGGVKSIVAQVPKGADPLGPEASPFQNEADYRAALADPEYAAAADRYFKIVGGHMEANLRKYLGLKDTDQLSTPTQMPGKPVNLMPWRPGDGKPQAGVVMTTGGTGGLTGHKARQYKFARRAKGSAAGYNIDAGHMIENALVNSEKTVAKAEMYRVHEAEGLMRRVKPGTDTEFGGKAAKVLPDVFKARGPGVERAEQGKTEAAYHPDVYPEVLAAMRMDRVGELSKNVPQLAAFKAVSNATTQANLLFSLGEITSHSKNLLTSLFQGARGRDIVSNLYKQYKGDKAFVDRVIELARIGAMKAPGLDTGTVSEFLAPRLSAKANARLETAGKFNPNRYTTMFLDALDKASRVALDDAATRLQKRGVRVDETMRRNFVNQIGNYDKGTQSRFVALLRELGVGPFATAGSNFWAQGIRSLTGEVGFRTGDRGMDVRLRAEKLLRTYAVLGAAQAANTLLWGNPFGDDDTPLGSVKVANKDGKVTYFDLTNLTGMTRGMRAVGALAVLDGMRQGHTAGEIADAAVKDVESGVSHPAMGPAVQSAWILQTGRDTLGRQVADSPSQARTPAGRQRAERMGKPDPGASEKWLNLQAVLWNLNPTAATVFGKDRPSTAEPVGAWERLNRLAGPYGLKTRKVK